MAEPATTLIEPTAPPEAVPEDRMTLPLFPEREEPDKTCTTPDDPATSTLADCTVMSPVPELALDPDATSIPPPVEAPRARPATMDTADPAPLPEEPTWSTTAPAKPLPAAPDTTLIDPLFPANVVPV